MCFGLPFSKIQSGNSRHWISYFALTAAEPKLLVSEKNFLSLMDKNQSCRPRTCTRCHTGIALINHSSGGLQLA